MDIEEREAAICPEDTGFEEYIKMLVNALRPFAAVHRPNTDPDEAVFVRDGDWILNRHLAQAARMVDGAAVHVKHRMSTDVNQTA